MASKAMSLSAMEKILKKIGAERVSDEAKIALREVLEEYAEQVGERSLKNSRHAGRKTIRAADIKLAAK